MEPEILNWPNEGIRWLAGGFCRRIARYLHVDNWAGWTRSAERACSTLTADDVDLILATGSPFASFGLAKRLSDRLGRPYVLDYRDPWSGNPHSTAEQQTDKRTLGVSRHAAIVGKEAQLLAGSAAVTIVSPSWGLALAERFGLDGKLHVLTNGYDPRELENVQPYDFGHFAIVYTGSFYPPKRVITPVMSALSLLKKSGEASSQWCFHYYGKDEAHVRNEAQQADVLERVVIHGTAPRKEALSAVRGAGVSVVISTVQESDLPEDQGIVPGKVFETMGLGRPTLVVAPAGSDVGTIAEAGGCARRYSGSDVHGIASFIMKTMREGTPSVLNRETYSWTTIAKQLDRILRVAADHNVNSGV
jgi:glycosyltransferase involved in cell wall biosynthesis